MMVKNYMINIILSKNLKNKCLLAFVPLVIVLLLSVILNSWNDFGNYIIAFTLQAIVMLVFLIPFFLIAFFHVKPELNKNGLLLIAILFFFLSEASQFSPRIFIFKDLYWNWQGKSLSFFGTLLLVYFWNGITFQEIGVTRKLNKGSIFPVILTVLISLILEILISERGRGASPFSTWLFQATLPGLDEEILYRGVLLTLANNVFGKPWKVFGAKIGWGFILTSLLFSFLHMVSVGSNMSITINWGNFFIPFSGGIVLAYLKERSGNIWTSVIYHNLANIASVFVGYLPV